MSQGTKPEGVKLEDMTTGVRTPIEVVFSHRDEKHDVKVYRAVLPPGVEDMDLRELVARYRLIVAKLPDHVCIDLSPKPPPPRA